MATQDRKMSAGYNRSGSENITGTEVKFDLQPQTTYDFKVYAYTSAGEGGSASIPETVPMAGETLLGIVKTAIMICLLQHQHLYQCQRKCPAPCSQRLI